MPITHLEGQYQQSNDGLHRKTLSANPSVTITEAFEACRVQAQACHLDILPGVLYAPPCEGGGGYEYE